MNPRTESRREVRSDTTGRFEFVGLPAGEYQLELAFGFEPTNRTVDVMNRHVDQDVTLRLGSLTETVTLWSSPGSEAAGAGVRATGPADMPRARACAASSTGGNIKPPMKVRDVHPVYPANGDAVPEEGTVLVDARIGADGTVVSAVAREPVSQESRAIRRRSRPSVALHANAAELCSGRSGDVGQRSISDVSSRRQMPCRARASARAERGLKARLLRRHNLNRG